MQYEHPQHPLFIYTDLVLILFLSDSCWFIGLHYPVQLNSDFLFLDNNNDLWSFIQHFFIQIPIEG